MHRPFSIARSRREFLTDAGLGFGSLALSCLMAQEAEAQQKTQAIARKNLPSELTPRQPMFAAKAKSVIFLFAVGGPSHVDTFDYKPALTNNDGKTMEGGRALMRSPFAFRPYSKSGLYVSEIFPNIGSCADDICFVHSITSRTGVHGAAVFEMNTGNISPGRPSLGSWVTYGLGTENQDLPAFVVMQDGGGPNGGSLNWANGFLPATFQGTALHSKGSPILDLQPARRTARAPYRNALDYLRDINNEHLADNNGDHDLEARIASYELAYRMQMEAPNALDISKENDMTLALYGINRKETDEFGRKCLMARRLVEKGVRFIQIYCGGGGAWDAHDNIAENHGKHALEIDRPIAGLIKDLKQRKLLDSTLIVWGGEFGRTPTSQNTRGRDHHTQAHTVWMAGGGVHGGTRVAHSDELGDKPAGVSYNVHDLHKTILHGLGLDDAALTYLHNGRYQQPTDTGGKLIKGVFT